MKKRFTQLFCLVLVFITGSAQAQKATVSGKVLSSDGKPVENVNITIKETRQTTLTKADGSYIIPFSKECTCSLVISYVGLKTQEKKVVLQNNQDLEVNFKLDQSAAKLEEVVVKSYKSLNARPVSVGKIAIDPMDLPQSMVVIGQGVIRDQQALRLSDVIKNVNGVYLATARASTQENFSARGYAFSSYNLFKNGSRINSGAMPEMSSLETVEVLKGSSAILFGQVSPGGIVNMVTKQPKFVYGGEVSMRVGSYDLYKPGFDVYGPISSSIAIRLNGTFESAKSYRDVVSAKRYYVNPSFLFKLGKSTDLIVEGDYLQHNFTPDFGIGSLGGTKIADLGRSAFLGASWQYAKTNQSTATATLRHKFNENWGLSTSLSYQNYSRDYFSIERIQADSIGDWVRPLGRTYANENYYVGQVNLTGNFKTKGVQHTLLAGIDADHYLTSNYAYQIASAAGLPANSYDKINILDPAKYPARTDIPITSRIRQIDLPVDRGGIYVQDLIKLSSKLNLLAGFRYSYVHSGAPDSTNLVTSANTKGKAKNDNAFSPRFGLVYKTFKQTSVFVSYSNSFTVNAGVNVNGNTLEPSIIDQYEAGVKNDFLNGKLSVNLTAYRIKNNNLAQTAPFLKDGVTPNNNANIKALMGETLSEGLEIDIAGRPTNDLNIMAGYSYNFIRVTKTPVAVGNFITGERLVNNPAHTANASIFYTFSKYGLKGFKIGATAVYIGKRFGGWNTDIIKTDPLTLRRRLIEVDGFATIDITAGYTYNKISLLAKVSNVTNTFNYYVHENYSINPIPPTQFSATLAYKF